ncbi:hypothetical protein M0805_002182 [Coniferiporia weirii]|nr:hypothetical protein M0805_002182 [Coniferiporia weirii]
MVVISNVPIFKDILDDYALPRDAEEQQRLEFQHAYLMDTIYRGKPIDESTLQPRPGSRVLDSGTGTGAWALALAKEVPESVEITGVDISSAFFPEDAVRPSNVRFHEASVTQLPEAWSNRFDFIHQRLLFWALTVSSWKVALSESFRVLKPGGTIQLMEHVLEGLPKSDGVAELRGLDISREVALAISAKSGFLSDITRRLPLLVKEAGFIDIVAEERAAPVGEGWGNIGRRGSENFGKGLRNAGPKAAKLGMSESNESFERISRGMMEGWDKKPGSFLTMLFVRATKPKSL